MKERTFLSVFVLLAGLNCIMTVINKDAFPHWLQILLVCLHVAIAVILIVIVFWQLKTMRKKKKGEE